MPERPPPHIPETCNIAHFALLHRLGQGFGPKPALLYGRRVYPYDECARRVMGVAAHLAEVGVEREQRVYVALPDCPPFVWALLGTMARGAVAAMGNPAAPPEQLAEVLSYIRPAALITTPEVAQALAPRLLASDGLKEVLLVPQTATGEDPEGPLRMPPALGEAAFGVAALAEACAGHSATVARPVTHRDDPAIWLFTSGSTGRPKAAMHSHRDLVFNTEVYAKATVGFCRDDVTVSAPRLYFGYATGTNLLFPLAVGATIALFSERPTPDRVARAVQRHRATVLTTVPTMMEKTLRHDAELRSRGKPPLDLSSLRMQLSAGEALPPPLLERYQRRFGAPVYDGIGSAEMFHIYISNRPGDVRPGSLGRLVPGYEARVVPEDALGPTSDEVPTGEVGELCVRGDSVASGYFQARDASWQTFHGHWCRTGDLMRRDAEGYFWFAGRVGERFKASGQWVSPSQVERALAEHPAVALCAVVPFKEQGLVKVKALVVLKPEQQHALRGPADEAELVEQLRQQVRATLAPHKVPREVVFVADLPRNDRGKVDRAALRRAEGERAQQPGERRRPSGGVRPARRTDEWLEEAGGEQAGRWLVDIAHRLDQLTSDRLAALAVEQEALAVLLPLGSVEPHGPHLPLGTDTVISEEVCRRAATALGRRGVATLIAPTLPYGVTRCAAGFPGALSVPGEALTTLLAAVASRLLEEGAGAVCLVSNHLEPEHHQAVLRAVEGLSGRAVVASPLSRRWARTLSEEFKSGQCHAGRYESSILLAAAPQLVDESIRRDLPEVPVSLSQMLKQGISDFRAMGLSRGYAGAPARATAEEGEEQLALLVQMVIGEVKEALASTHQG